MSDPGKLAALSPVEIAAGRRLPAGGAVPSLALARGEAPPPLWHRPVLALTDLVDALHLGFYTASLNFTTIAHRLAIIYTEPIVAVLASWWLLCAFCSAALHDLPAATVNVIVTPELTGGVRLDTLLLGEIPSPSTLAGLVAAPAGIFLVLL